MFNQSHSPIDYSSTSPHHRSRDSPLILDYSPFLLHVISCLYLSSYFDDCEVTWWSRLWRFRDEGNQKPANLHAGKEYPMIRNDRGRSHIARSIFHEESSASLSFTVWSWIRLHVGLLWLNLYSSCCLLLCIAHLLLLWLRLLTPLLLLLHRDSYSMILVRRRLSKKVTNSVRIACASCRYCSKGLHPLLSGWTAEDRRIVTYYY